MQAQNAPGAVSPDAVFKRLVPLIANQLGKQASDISPESYLEDLGASSLDLVELTLDAEQEFGVLLAGRPLFDTAVLVVGPGILEDEGELTEAGRTLVARRFPHLTAAEVAEMTDISEVQRQISRVSVWTETIATLTAMIPQRCSEAGGDVSVGADGIPSCSGAGADYRQPSLEEWNESWLTELRDSGAL